MYRIAGIDVHKKMLAVVVTDVEIESEYQFERRMFGSNPEHLRSLAAWLAARTWKAHAVSREPSIWHKRNPIAGGADEREISSMPNAW